MTYDRSDIFSRYSIKHYVKFVRSATCSRSVVFFSYSIQHFVKFVCDLAAGLWILSEYSMHHVIKFVGDLWQVSDII